MKIGDIVYFIDKGAKYYFDMKFIKIIHLDKYNIDLYRCEILMNQYKFNNNAYAPNFDLRGKIDNYSRLSIVTSKEEAENAIK